MPLFINTNVGSLNAQRNLVKSGMEMSTAMERLSSGLRINTAADDAAGLTITNRMTSQIRGLDQAVRNANDGISLVRTTEGALGEVTNILARMRELAVQSANGIYTDADRSTLNAEVSQLKSELTRIAETTSFNGLNVLDGSNPDFNLQVGADANQTVSFSLQSFTADTLGESGVRYDLVGAETAAADLLTGLKTVAGGANTSLLLDGTSVGDLSGAATLNEAIDLMNDELSSEGITASAFTSYTADETGSGIISGDDQLNLTLDDADGNSFTYVIQNTSSMDEVVNKINTLSDGKIKASLDADGILNLESSDGGQITVSATAGNNENGANAAGFDVVAGTDEKGKAQLAFKSDDGSTIDVQYSGTTTLDTSEIGLQTMVDNDVTGAQISGTTAVNIDAGDIVINGVEIGAITGNATPATAMGNIITAINLLADDTGVVASLSGTAGLQLNSIQGGDISIEIKGKATFDLTGLVNTNSTDVSGNAIEDVDISTASGAQSAIEIIDLAIDTVSSKRSELGAVSNRLDFTVSNLMNVSENTAAARSRILDADFASETAALSKAQVLQQATSAMLAQANAMPQQVLSLLR